MSFLTRVTSAAAYPVTVAELKANARIETDDEDALVASYIAVATSSVEEMTSRALMPQVWNYKFRRASGREYVTLPVAPVSSIASMTYQDRDDVEQSLTVSDYYLFGDQNKATVRPKDNIDWPQTFDRPDAISMTINAGYANASDVPEGLRFAVTLLASHWYENRIPVTEKRMLVVPFAVEHLVNLERRGWIAA